MHVFVIPDTATCRLGGHPAGVTMEVLNSGTTELDALIMFVVDATKPFSRPAKFE